MTHDAGRARFINTEEHSLTRRSDASQLSDYFRVGWASSVQLVAKEEEQMSKREIDAYLADVDEPGHSSLQKLRETILSLVPHAEEVISYKMPAFRVDGGIVAGFGAFKNHLSYLPFSGSVLPQLETEIEGYDHTVSALHFPAGRPLPRLLVKKLIDARLAQIREHARD